MRRKRWVLALEAVKRAAGMGGPGSPEAHCMVLRFCHAAQSEQVSRHPGPSKAELTMPSYNAKLTLGLLVRYAWSALPNRSLWRCWMHGVSGLHAYPFRSPCGKDVQSSSV